MARIRRYATYLGLSICVVLFLTRLSQWSSGRFVGFIPLGLSGPGGKWAKFKPFNPVGDMTPLPSDRPQQLPRIQQTSFRETKAEKSVRVARQEEVETAFMRCWTGYAGSAWGRDGLRVVTDHPIISTSGGWAETLVDSFDTLYIMEKHEEVDRAVEEMAKLNFGTSETEELDISYLSARLLGGLLSGYELSGKRVLLQKAIQLGDMIYAAFDTPDRMPIPFWNWQKADNGERQETSSEAILADMASMCLDLTRLSQVTGDPRWYDAAVRIVHLLEEQQQQTRFPGMWPASLNLQTGDFSSESGFGLGAMSDAAYEFLPKMHALLGGVDPIYEKMYVSAMEVALNHTLFRPMTPDNRDILFPGYLRARSADDYDLEPEGQHLSCFASGMLGLGSRLFGLDEHMEYAAKILEGCIWAYDAFVFGIMPELFHLVPCQSTSNCQWDESTWHEEVASRIPDEVDGRPVPPELKKDVKKWIKKDLLPKGFTSIEDRRHFLRSDVAESIFYLYRITGRRELQDMAWAIFSAVDKFTQTEKGNAALYDVTVTDKVPVLFNEMLSQWMSETLKFFYLTFSDPNLLSLDEWVFNTAGHPYHR